jgi:hypothetical protein
MLHFDYDTIDNYFSEVKAIITNAILSRKGTKFNHQRVGSNNSSKGEYSKKSYLSYDDMVKLYRLNKGNFRIKTNKEIEKQKRKQLLNKGNTL